MIQQLLQSDSTGISILLVVAIVIAFVVAFKVMQMVFETVVVTVLSGAFYLTMRYLQGGAISLNDMLLFSFLGATLYMLYSLLGTLYKTAATIIPLPYKIVKTVAQPFEWIWEKYEERQKRKSYVSRDKVKKQEKSDEEGDKSTKEVILGNKKEDEDDED